MIKALIKKEWKKTSIVVYSIGLFSLLALVNIYFDLSNAMEMMNPSEVVSRLINRQDLEVSYFFLNVAVFGMLLALAQFKPEKDSARVRLHLHLPLSKSFLINFFLIYGLALIAIFSVITTVLFFFILMNFVPIELFYAFASKLLAYICLSVIGYLGTAILIMNPKIKIKIAIFILTMLLVVVYGGYTVAYFSGENLYYYFIFIVVAYYFALLNTFDLYTRGYTK